MTHSPRPVTYDTSEIKVPPAHSIRDGMVPIVAGTVPIVAGTVPSTPKPQHINITPVPNDKGSKLALQAPIEHPVTQTDEDSKVVRGSDLSGEPRPVQEGKLLIVENPRFHQVPPPVPGPSGVELLMTEGTSSASAPIAPSITDEPPRQGISVVREIRQEFEPPDGPPPGVLLSVPAGEPRTPRKSAKNTGSPSPQKSGFLDSLKKVFHGGGGHRESRSTPQEKTREKEKREKAREREVRREEKREEHQRDKQERAKEKKKQKLAREHKREMRLLAPSSSSEDDELVVDDDSLRRYRKKKEGEARTSKFVGKAGEKEGMSLSASESRNDEPSWTADGFLMRKNVDLEKNLKGGILEAKRGEQPPGLRRSCVVGMAMEDRRVGGDVSVRRSGFIVERGAKCTQNPSVSPFVQSSSTGIPSSSVRRLNDTRFREELDGTTSPMLVDSDTPFSPAIGVTAAVARKTSKKQPVMPSTVGGEDGKPISVLQEVTAPGGMGDTVSASVLTPRASGMHRRAVSGQRGRVSAPGVSLGREVGSLMSIVDDVTRSNRRAWERGGVSRVDDDVQRRRLLPEPVGGDVVRGPGHPGLAPLPRPGEDLLAPLEDEDRERDSASGSSSYETGHEDIEDDVPRRYVGEVPLLKRKSVRVSLNPKSVAWDDSR